MRRTPPRSRASGSTERPHPHPSFHPLLTIPAPRRCRFSETDTAIDYFGKQLLASGYNYFGSEPMYSGITGQEFAADIYFGVVYYQRLRHMVLDKFQVRTTGPVDPLTRQPVKVRLPPLLSDEPIADATPPSLSPRAFTRSATSP